MTDESGPELPDDRDWSREVHRSALLRHGANGPCEACGNISWGVGERMLLLHALEPSGTVVPGRGVEVVPVFCTECGLLHLHVASMLLRE
jgi:hypothetical protein